MKTGKIFEQTAFFISISLINASFFISITLHAQLPQTVPKQQVESKSKEGTNQFINATLTYTIIDAPNNTFGYDIYADGRKMIHQPSVPAVPGNAGFKNKADAVKVAKLVIVKIEKGEMPPTVTVEEIRKIKVII